jgi:hypothetical protein
MGIIKKDATGAGFVADCSVLVVGSLGADSTELVGSFDEIGSSEEMGSLDTMSGLDTILLEISLLSAIGTLFIAL